MLGGTDAAGDRLLNEAGAQPLHHQGLAAQNWNRFSNFLFVDSEVALYKLATPVENLHVYQAPKEVRTTQVGRSLKAGRPERRK